MLLETTSRAENKKIRCIPMVQMEKGAHCWAVQINDERNTNAGINVTPLGLSNNGWVLFLLLIWDKVLRSPGWPWTCYVVQPGLKLLILPPLTPKSWDYKCVSLPGSRKSISGASEMAQWVKIPVPNRDNLSSIPRTTSGKLFSDLYTYTRHAHTQF